ncbi:DUF881 domain-containing protein [Blastococcus sp. VKM Ac-2987]|uniref:DUF881 domain-containing protein n=1 Tax=Blastococcus sp. VKM Ac-2987 TaxID=3004141 RepID=UPI0022AB8B2A|nr:DUF881 domain-containing protein [Blastococcus sp. VKM Ac-2987]MCZ2860976.1 DUF881 domain-containing protein [Blastococcus sp. VKM Ac-2987]
MSDAPPPGTPPPGQSPAGASPADGGAAGPPARPPAAVRRRRNLVAAALIGVLTMLLGFALAVQVRNSDEAQMLAGAREEDLVRILDELASREERLRAQLAEQRAALRELGGSGSRTGTALEDARGRAEALGILNGTLPAQGPGLTLAIDDPSGEVRVSDVIDVIQELRGAGAETMQVDDVRIGLSTAVTGTAGNLRVDGTPLRSPYEFVVLGDPQGMETAMNIPGGVVQRIERRGGTVRIAQSPGLVVDALRPLDRPQYASPGPGG